MQMNPPFNGSDDHTAGDIITMYSISTFVLNTYMCSATLKTHITKDMSFQGEEHISLRICVSQVGEHISLGICVSQVGEHTSQGICVSRGGGGNTYH